MKALINANIFDFHNFKENSYILFHDSEIKEVGDMSKFPGADEVFDCSGTIVMPGLINCHTHIYSTFARGMNVEFNPKKFQDILDQLWWKLDGQLDKEAVYHSGLIYGCECIKNGVTSIIDHHASGLDIKGSLDQLKKGICDELGMRGIFCFETSDRFDVKECIEENIEFAKNKSQQCAGLFGMHASMSLSDNTLKEISSAIEDIPIHVHVAESEEDVEDCNKKYGKSIIQRLNDFGLLKKNSILAHCVHIDEKEVELIAKKGCNIAMNPTSNMNNAVGLANYDIFRKLKVPCMIGNDGLGVNITRDFLNIVFGMKNRLNNPTKFDLNDLVNMINNGYEYFSHVLGIKVGKIEECYKADLITIPYDSPTPLKKDNILGHVFFGIFDNFHPRDTWCSGKCMMKDYKLNIDIDSIYSRARCESEKVWKRINGD
ncbi:amidohydrolase family protein [Clostridium sp. MB40-C1]|uniref:amidohydrolase family protein n=1 Tax=Clostridium sp. MB40-C1 TaxID=3070996 RepID=UPI0027DF0BD8|nr:amidohydrolase family protein [Clostridium sp. MB40-C1]WMJ79762.1 amidohydrolase family protein [Clostridium sp. MB40-C1]